ncbi:MAG: hypothetical protein ABL921_21860 [Pirellula sp.]
MAKDDDDDDSLPPLGENTVKFLDQAKKGQPRNFLLVCKGNKVKYLAVRKKPIKKNELNDAKKSGYKGEGYFGVITGKGMELVFNLSIADGYTAEPVKDKILKDFLEEKADFKCKPTIAIVATLPEIPFDEEDLSNPLIARFLSLGEQITQVLDMNPSAEGELRQTTTEIRGLLQDADFGSAEPRIIALEARLQALLNGAPANTPSSPRQTTSPQVSPQPPNPPSTSNPPAPTSTTTTAPGVDNDALKLKLQEALNKLVPQLKQAVMNYPEKKVELLTPVAEIKKQLDTGELQEAKKGILAVGQLLKSVLTQGGNESKPPVENSLRMDYERKLVDLQPNYSLALKEMLGDTSKFRSVMAYAVEQAAAGVYESAIKAIDRLNQAVAQAISSGGNRSKDTNKPQAAAKQEGALNKDLVPGEEPWELSPQFETLWVQAKLAWNASIDSVNAQLSQLRSSLLESEDSDLISIAEFGLNAMTANHMVPLQAAIIDIDRASGDDKIMVIDLARDTVLAFTEHVEREERIDACDNNPFNVTVTLRSNLTRGLSELATALDEALI